MATRAIDTIANRITLEGGAEILKFLDSMGKEGQAAATKLRDAFAKSGFDKGVSDKIGGIRKSLLGLGGDARTAAAGLTPLRTALQGLQAFAGGVFGGAGLSVGLGAGGLGALLATATLAVSRNANAIKDQAREFNVSTDSVQKYEEVLNNAGLKNEQLGGILSTLTDKVADNEKKFKSATKEVEIFGGKTSTVVKGVRGIDEVTGKLKDSFDFEVPTEQLGKVGDTTVTVKRGFQELNKQADLAQRLFGGLSTSKLDEALQTIAKRFKEAGGSAQLLVDAGISLRGSRVIEAFLNSLADAGNKAADAGDQIDGFVKKLTGPELDKVGNVTTELDKFFTNISRLFARNVARTGSGGFLETLNQQLERMDNRNRNGQIINDLANLEKVARQVSQTLQTNASPGAGRVALFTGLAQDAEAAKAPLEGTSDALQRIRALAMGTATPGAGLSAGVGSAGTGLLGNLLQGATDATTATDALAQSLQGAQQAADAAGQALSTAGQNVHIDVPASAFADFELQAQEAAQRAAAGLPPPFQSAWAEIEADARSAFATIGSIIDGIIASINQAVSRIAKLRSSSGDTSDNAFSFTGLAGGGQVFGAGSKTSDSVIARLSRGEFVIKAASVDHYGPGLFALLNSMRLPRDLLAHLRGFDTGGLVEAMRRSFPVPHYATGGPVSIPALAGASGRAVNIILPSGQKIGPLIASEGVILDAQRHAQVMSKHLTTRRRVT